MRTSTSMPGRELRPLPREELPNGSWMRARLSRLIALGGGSGLAPVLPGTAGTLTGWALFALLSPLLSRTGWCIVIAVGFAIGLWAVDRVGRELGQVDHGSIVWDEIIAIWLVLLLTPPTFLWQLAAVALFRVFDMGKPEPVRWVERNTPGAWGVMLDDIVAAAYALLILWLAQ